MIDLPPALSRAIGDRDARLSLLVVRLGALGDILRTIPAVRLIRRGMPGASIHWAVDDRWQRALDGIDEIDGTAVLPRRDWQACLRSPLRWPALARSVGGFRQRLRELRPDLVLDFHGNLRSGFVGWISGAAVRVGYDGPQQKEANRRFTTHRVAAGPRRMPRMERNLALVRALGLADGPLPLGDLPLARAGRSSAESLVGALARPDRPLAVVNPGASRSQAYKRPPAELLAAAARAAARRGLTPLVVWGPGEEEEARGVVAVAGDAACLAPPTDLATLAALIERARLFVSGDSGPLHMACLLGRPVVALYGGTDPEINAPWGVPSRVLAPEGRVYTGIKREDRGSGGFEGLAAERVAEAVESLLDETT